MPTLIIQNGTDRYGGTFEWPLLIGSCAANAVMIADNSVAHVHAWIGRTDNGYYVANVTRGGRTFVNGVAIQSRQALNSGDTIQVGGSTRIIYINKNALPDDIRPIDFPWRAPSIGMPDDENAIECGCGATVAIEPPGKPANGAARPAPRQAPETATASSGRRPPVPQPVEGAAASTIQPAAKAPAPLATPAQPSSPPAPSKPRSGIQPAGKPVPRRSKRASQSTDTATLESPRTQPVIPDREPPTPRPLATGIPSLEPVPAADVVMCGICQSTIDPSEQMTRCPQCALTFHADCWTENRGCAAYGCSQVGVLEPPDAAPAKDVDIDQYVDPFPWEFLLLGASVVTAIGGALVFGIPSALLIIVTFVAAARKGLQRWPLLVFATALCLAGLVVGVEFSRFWWLGIRPFQ